MSTDDLVYFNHNFDPHALRRHTHDSTVTDQPARCTLRLTPSAKRRGSQRGAGRQRKKHETGGRPDPVADQTGAALDCARAAACSQDQIAGRPSVPMDHFFCGRTRKQVINIVSVRHSAEEISQAAISEASSCQASLFLVPDRADEERKCVDCYEGRYWSEPKRKTEFKNSS